MDRDFGCVTLRLHSRGVFLHPARSGVTGTQTLYRYFDNITVAFPVSRAEKVHDFEIDKIRKINNYKSKLVTGVLRCHERNKTDESRVSCFNLVVSILLVAIIYGLYEGDHYSLNIR